MQIIDPKDGIEVASVQTQYTVQTPSGRMTISPTPDKGEAQREQTRADAELRKAGSVESSILLSRKAHYSQWKVVE